MYTVELGRLEKQISILLDAYVALRHDNQQLKNQLASSIQERANLQTKNQQLAKQVKTIISQLRDEMS
ncbi:MAG: hypothetical protein P1U63_10145 [Coxiellaceae bacterium]|nr:hypothetical protein [Coxiellaceae bacterium]